MRGLVRSFIIWVILTTSFIARAYWKDNFPPAPFETVTKEQIKDLEKKIKTLIPVCTDRLEKRFGKAWKRNRQGFPKFLSIKVISKKEAETFEGFAETRGSFFIGMKFSPYPFLSGQADLETTVCHETVHAYFRKHMSFGTYARLPKWAREGGAVYLVNQLSHKERRVLISQWSGEEDANFNGLEGTHSLDDYYEDALAFTFLHDKYTADDRVLSLVIEGESIYEAIEQSTGLNKERFLKEALNFSKDYVAKRLQSLSKENREAVANWSNPTARYKAIAGFMNQFKAGISQTVIPETLDFGLSLAFSLEAYSEGDEQELIQDYERVLSEVPSFKYGTNGAGVRYKLAWLNLKVGNYTKALHYYTLIFNENVEVPILQQSATAGILRAYVGLADWARVLAWAKLERGLYESDLVEYRYYRGLAYRALGNAKKAKTMLEFACSSNLNHRFKEKACQILAH